MPALSPLSLAQHRDRIRRLFGQVVPIDEGTGIAGAQPTQFPFPLNDAIDDAFIMATSWVSRKVPKLVGNTNPELLQIPAQTVNGPYAVPLWNIAPVGSVNEVRRTAWIDSSGGQEQQLTPSNRDNLDRDGMSVMTTPPSNPTRTWIESGALMVWPAPSSGGILSILVGKALGYRLQGLDTDVVPTIPNDYLDILDYRCVETLCGTQPDDVVYSALLSLTQKEIYGNGRDTGLLDDLKSFVSMRNQSFESNMTARTGRSGILRSRR